MLKLLKINCDENVPTGPKNRGFYLCKTPTSITIWEVLWWSGWNWKLGQDTWGCLSPSQQKLIKEVYGPLGH